MNPMQPLDAVEMVLSEEGEAVRLTATRAQPGWRLKGVDRRQWLSLLPLDRDPCVWWVGRGSLLRRWKQGYPRARPIHSSRLFILHPGHLERSSAGVTDPVYLRACAVVLRSSPRYAARKFPDAHPWAIRHGLPAAALLQAHGAGVVLPWRQGGPRGRRRDYGVYPHRDWRRCIPWLQQQRVFDRRTGFTH